MLTSNSTSADPNSHRPVHRAGRHPRGGHRRHITGRRPVLAGRHADRRLHHRDDDDDDRDARHRARSHRRVQGGVVIAVCLLQSREARAQGLAGLPTPTGARRITPPSAPRSSDQPGVPPALTTVDAIRTSTRWRPTSGSRDVVDQRRRQPAARIRRRPSGDRALEPTVEQYLPSDGVTVLLLLVAARWSARCSTQLHLRAGAGERLMARTSYLIALTVGMTFVILRAESTCRSALSWPLGDDRGQAAAGRLDGGDGHPGRARLSGARSACWWA